MTIGQFLRMLHENGSLRISAGRNGLSMPDGDDADLIEMDRVARLELIGSGPDLLPAVVQWAARMLYDCCRCYAFRSLDAAEVAALLAAPCPRNPGWTGPQVAYSADLALRYLPDLLRLSRGISPGDPLVLAMIDLGKAWPLSSVGIPEVDGDAALDISAILEDRSLRELYVDRVISRDATDRLKDSRIAGLARGALGLYPGLAPQVAAALSALEVS